MGFPRRRSLWLKVGVLGTAVWVTVCFLLYTEDRTAGSADQGLAPSGVAMPQAANGFAPPAAPLKKETPGSQPNKARINQAGPEQGNFTDRVSVSLLLSFLFFFFFFFLFSICFRDPFGGRFSLIRGIVELTLN